MSVSENSAVERFEKPIIPITITGTSKTKKVAKRSPVAEIPDDMPQLVGRLQLLGGPIIPDAVCRDVKALAAQAQCGVSVLNGKLGDGSELLLVGPANMVHPLVELLGQRYGLSVIEGDNKRSRRKGKK